MVFRKLWSRRVMIPLIGLAIVLVVARTSNPQPNPYGGFSLQAKPLPNIEPYRVSLSGYSASTLATMDTSEQIFVNFIQDDQGKIYFSHNRKIYGIDQTNQVTPILIHIIKGQYDHDDALTPGFIIPQPDKSWFVLNDFGHKLPTFTTSQWDFATITQDFGASKFDTYKQLYTQRVHLEKTSAIITDSNGNGYVTHPGYSEIFRISTGESNRWLTLPTLTSQESGKPQAARPTAITIDVRSNLIYVYDEASGSIFSASIRPDGSADTVHILTSMYGHHITAMAVDPQGRLLLAEERGNDGGIWRIARDGKRDLLVRGLGTPVAITTTDRGIYFLEDTNDAQSGTAYRKLRTLSETGAVAVVPTRCIRYDNDNSYLDIDTKENWSDYGESGAWYSPSLENTQYLARVANYSELEFRPTTPSETAGVKHGDLIWSFGSEVEQAHYRRVQVLAYDINLPDNDQNAIASLERKKFAWVTVEKGVSMLNLIDLNDKLDGNKRQKLEVKGVLLLIAFEKGVILTAFPNQRTRTTQFISYDAETLTVKASWQAGNIERLNVTNKSGNTCMGCNRGIVPTYNFPRVQYIEKTGEGKRQLVFADYETGQIAKGEMMNAPFRLDIEGFNIYSGYHQDISIFKAYVHFTNGNTDPQYETSVPTNHILDLKRNKIYILNASVADWSADGSIAYLMENCTLKRLDMATGAIITLKEKVLGYSNESGALMIAGLSGECDDYGTRRESEIYGVNRETGELVALTSESDPMAREQAVVQPYSKPLILATQNGIITTDTDFKNVRHYQLFGAPEARGYAKHDFVDSTSSWLFYATSTERGHDKQRRSYRMNYETGISFDVTTEIMNAAGGDATLPIYRSETAYNTPLLIVHRYDVRREDQLAEIGLHDLATGEYQKLTTIRGDADLFWTRDDQYFGAMYYENRSTIMLLYKRDRTQFQRVLQVPVRGSGYAGSLIACPR